MQTSPSADARIRLLAPLGHGGMSDVWLGALRGPAGFEKLVAVKQLRFVPSHAFDGGSAFLREARLAALLNHPNIVHTFEVVAQGGDYRIVMEFVEGQPLNRILRRRSEVGIPLPDLVRVMGDVLAGLHHAHELSDRSGRPLHVVHRDVSPHNVFVSWEGAVKLLDFGIAAFERADDTSKERGLVMGKLSYMAPEQAAGKPVDRRADVFAAGAVLWQILTGEQLWAGLADPLLYTELVAGHIPSIDERAPEAPAELRRICQMALAPDPNDRFPTAEAMQQALDDWLDATGGRPNPRGLGELVSNLFAADRERIRAIVAQGLATDDEGGNTDLYAPTPARPLERAASAIPSAAGGPDLGRWTAALVAACMVLSFGSVGVSVLIGGAGAAWWYWNQTQPVAPSTVGACAADPRTEVELSGMLDQDATLPCTRDYRLTGVVRVQPGATLTIAAGTVLRGTPGSVLVVSRGARLIAEGTADLPIVFTSAAATPAPGDWGGLVLLGYAPTNQPDGRFKGLTVEGDLYGGDRPDDDSGVLSHVRIEYAGTVLAPNNETNGITFAGVGRGTRVDHLEVRNGIDDCFEWFGGTMDASHLVCVNPGDDAFDIEYGYTGTLSSLVVVDRTPPAPERDGFEVDNAADAFDIEPRTAPTITGVTLCGPGGDAGYGLLVRRGATGTWDGLWVDGYPAVLDVRDGPGPSVRNVSAAIPLGPVEDQPAGSASPGADDDGGLDDAALIGGATSAPPCEVPPVGPIGGLMSEDRWDRGWVVWE